MKSDIINLSKDTLVYGTNYMILRMLGIITMPILTRIFSPSDYGTREIIYVSINFLAVLISLNINLGFSRYFFKQEDISYKRKAFSSSLIICLLISFVVIFFVLMFKTQFLKFLFKDVSTDYYSYLYISLLGIPFTLILERNLLLMRLLRKKIQFLVTNIFHALNNLTLIILLIVIFRLGLIGAFSATTIASALSCIFSAFFVKDYFSVKISSNILKNILLFSLPAFPSVIIDWFIKQSNNFFLLYYLSTSALGLFAVSNKVGIVVLSLIGIFRLSFDPFAMSIMDQKDFPQRMIRIFEIAMVCSISLSLFIAISSKLIIRILAPIQYFEAYKVVPVISFSYCLLFIGHFMGMRILAAEKTKFFSYISFGVLSAVMLSNFFIVPWLGIIGAALVLYFGYATRIVGQYLITSKVRKVNFPAMKYILQIIFYSAFMTIGYYFFTNLLYYILMVFTAISCFYIFNKNIIDKSVILLCKYVKTRFSIGDIRMELHE